MLNHTMTVEFSTTDSPSSHITVKNVSVIEQTSTFCTIITTSGMVIDIPQGILEDFSWKADN